jgi:DNA mismatch repair protein MutS
MVEMQETANILHTATSRSLVVLDEPDGARPPSTASASRRWPSFRHQPKMRPKTLFATHYHELTDLADATPGGTLTSPPASGRTTSSFAQDCARPIRIGAMAFRWRGWPGLPRSVIDRAREILGALERDELTRGGRPSVSGTPSDPQRQLARSRRRPPAMGCATNSPPSTSTT